jgi:hypothetical protein
MANPQIYADELKKFTEKYHLENYDLVDLQDFDERFKHLSDFLSSSVVGGNAAQQFINWASKTLKSVLETNTVLNQKGEYLPSFTPKKFLADFEKLVDAQYRSTLDNPEESNRAIYNNASIEDVMFRFVIETKKMNKPLPTLWMERLKDRSMDIYELEDVMTRAYNKMLDESVNKEEMRGELTNIVAAREAMAQLRASRNTFFGWFWKLFNSERNELEESLLGRLDTQINRLKAIGYKVEAAQAGILGKTVMGIKVKNAKKAEEKEEVKSTETTKSASKSVEIEPVYDKIYDVYMASDVKGDIVKELAEKIPNNQQISQGKLLFGYNRLVNMVSDSILELNKNFDSAIASGGDPKKEMAKVVKEIFKISLSATKQLSDQKVVMIEEYGIVAKVLTDKLTAVSIRPNEFSELANNCIERSVAIYKEALAEGKNPEQAMKTYEESFDKEFVNVDERVKLFDANNNPFVENQFGKSEQVPNVPQQNVPTLNSNK